MKGDFKSFHNKNNPDKQDIEQFISAEKLDRIMELLLQAQDSLE
jgi:hypothetical protein